MTSIIKNFIKTFKGARNEKL